MSPEQLLGSVQSEAVIGDLEAGIGTLTRLESGSLDAVIVVVEPTPKSLEVGTRAADLAREESLGRVIVVANRITSDEDAKQVQDAFGDQVEMVIVPHEPVIVQAERGGTSPLDLDPDAPGVAALASVADLLMPAPAVDTQGP